MFPSCVCSVDLEILGSTGPNWRRREENNFYYNQAALLLVRQTLPDTLCVCVHAEMGTWVCDSNSSCKLEVRSWYAVSFIQSAAKHQAKERGTAELLLQKLWLVALKMDPNAEVESLLSEWAVQRSEMTSSRSVRVPRFRINRNRPKLIHNIELLIKKWDCRCCHTPASRPVGLPSRKKNTHVEVLWVNHL